MRASSEVFIVLVSINLFVMHGLVRHVYVTQGGNKNSVIIGLIEASLIHSHALGLLCLCCTDYMTSERVIEH